MSSNFDKTLNEASANRRAIDIANSAKESEKLRQENIARSIAEPYLRDLGPKVVHKLRELKIAPSEAYSPPNLFRRRRSIRWWSFEGTSSEDKNTRICRLENGTFVKSAPFYHGGWDEKKPDPVSAPLFRVDEILAKVDSSGTIYLWTLGDFDSSQVFADPESRLVYVVPGNTTFSSVPRTLQPSLHDPVQELSVYIANHIQYKHVR